MFQGSSFLIREHPRKSAVKDFEISYQCKSVKSVVCFSSLMEKKIFWMLFLILGTIMDVALPIWWSLALTLPLLVLCWWIAYKSGWFD